MGALRAGPKVCEHNRFFAKGLRKTLFLKKGFPKITKKAASHETEAYTNQVVDLSSVKTELEERDSVYSPDPISGNVND